MKIFYIALAMVLALSMAGPALAGPPVDGNPDHDSVSNYQIISATQTGASQVTVRVKAHYCTACNPNSTNAAGCTPFLHGYPGPPPYSSTTHWCYPSNVDGRYAAVQLRDSGGTAIGTAKMVLNPTNWALCSILQRNIVVNTTTPMTPGSTITVEADLYCSWCGHYYPAPVSMTVAALASITVTPSTASILIGGTQAYTATGTDTLGNPVPINPTWSVTPGLGNFSPPVGPSTTFTGTTAGTSATVSACVGNICGTATVTVIQPNRPPVADAGPDQTKEQTSHEGADVTLDGSGSYDLDEDPLTYAWTWDSESASGVNPTVTFPLGTTEVTLTVFDGEYSDSDTVDIIVEDTTDPTIDCVEAVNPHGKNIPGDKASGQGKGNNPDGFYEISVSDICDPEPKVWVGTEDNPMIFNLTLDLVEGSIVVKFTEAPGAAPSCKKIGSTKGQAGAVTYHITLPSEPVVTACDASGNVGTCTCKVPPPPK